MISKLALASIRVVKRINGPYRGPRTRSIFLGGAIMLGARGQVPLPLLAGLARIKYQACSFPLGGSLMGYTKFCKNVHSTLIYCKLLDHRAFRLRIMYFLCALIHKNIFCISNPVKRLGFTCEKQLHLRPGVQVNGLLMTNSFAIFSKSPTVDFFYISASPVEH